MADAPTLPLPCVKPLLFVFGVASANVYSLLKLSDSLAPSYVGWEVELATAVVVMVMVVVYVVRGWM